MHEIQDKLLKIISNRDISGISLRGIGNLIGESSAQKVRHHLIQLAKKGFISFDSKNRTIKIIPKVSEDGIFISLPIYGSANCGPETIFADNNIDGYLKVSKKIIHQKGDLFVLRAVGNSMNRANIKNGKSINDGDFVIVDAGQKIPEPGQYIVSVIDGKANIKKFVIDRDNNMVILKSESTQEYFPIYIHEDDNYHVSGRVIDVIKN